MDLLAMMVGCRAIKPVADDETSFQDSDATAADHSMNKAIDDPVPWTMADAGTDKKMPQSMTLCGNERLLQACKAGKPLEIQRGLPVSS